ncbi:peptide ABC transporter permease [Pontibacillus halophilus JSM 076056 = DSM 19796]|uniref:Peptide ABC transporter permease n=1 Tax=Pontibacillus halophilus JSM 076056 = DSM 19796 TaxID=1385510 RepID=A0A0A5GNE7_9BACI|nr:oligopeptide ABC transporter permease [Pontibacillus halophilus]KGX92690.1 peptide ABC transporter permease [Pontibacillus halophilus JSM 076056 = DSM 19796]
MIRFIAQRLVYMLITLFIIASISFFLTLTLPGSPLTMEDKLSDAQREIVLEKYGLNDPVPIQYLNYMGNLVQGDLGVSFIQDNREVTSIIVDKLGPSAQLGAQGLFFGLLVGLLLGLLSALYHNSPIDYGSTFVAVVGKSIPSFVFAGILQYYIAMKLGWLPVAFWEGFSYTILPTLAVSMFPIAIAARFMRTEMLEVMGADYITTARAKGVNKFGVVWKHGIRNALIPLVTIIGPLVISLFTGNLVIENIFAVPGIGDTFVTAVMTNDYPVIMGTTLLISFVFVLVILLIDVLYGLIDPRIRLSGGGK